MKTFPREPTLSKPYLLDERFYILYAALFKDFGPGIWIMYKFTLPMSYRYFYLEHCWSLGRKDQTHETTCSWDFETRLCTNYY